MELQSESLPWQIHLLQDHILGSRPSSSPRTACDFHKPAASGFVAVLPRFLVKQLKSSKKLYCTDPKLHTARLPKILPGHYCVTEGGVRREQGD